jgi:hypothetical protein
VCTSILIMIRGGFFTTYDATAIILVLVFVHSDAAAAAAAADNDDDAAGLQMRQAVVFWALRQTL